LKDVCSCLSLHNDSYILILSNIVVNAVKDSRISYYETIQSKIIESVSEIDEYKSELVISDMIEPVKAYKQPRESYNALDNINFNLLKYIYNNLYDRSLTDLTLAKDTFNRFHDILKMLIINYDKNNNNQLESLYNEQQQFPYTMKTGMTNIERDITKGYTYHPDQLTNYLSVGGGRASQFYIEYFMKNPHKMKKEDKKNIRNILKEEQFEDELADFIKSHLKL
jgi:hypothetical protein